jgi:hypothetical protein
MLKADSLNGGFKPGTGKIKTDAITMVKATGRALGYSGILAKPSAIHPSVRLDKRRVPQYSISEYAQKGKTMKTKGFLRVSCFAVLGCIITSCLSSGDSRSGESASSILSEDTSYKSRILEMNNKYQIFIDEYNSGNYLDNLYALYGIVTEDLDYIIQNRQSVEMIRDEAKSMRLLNSVRTCRAKLSSGLKTSNGYLYSAYYNLTSGLIGCLNDVLNSNVTIESRISNIQFFKKRFLDNYELARQEQIAYEEARLARERQQEEARLARERQKEGARLKLANFMAVYIKQAIQIGSPLLILGYNTDTPNSAGGVGCYVRFVNVSTKRIKYVDFAVVPHNRFDDIAYSDIDGESEKIIRAANYIQPNEYYNSHWENVWYNLTISYMKIINYKVTYDDNTVQTINDKEIIEKAVLRPDEYTEYLQLDSNVNSFSVSSRRLPIN